MLPTLGIIAGGGLLPITVADLYMKRGGKCYIAALEGEADLEVIKGLSYQSFKIGMVGAIIKYFHKFSIKNIVFAGSVNRPNFRSIKVDIIGSILLARIVKQKFLGDDKVLRIIANFLEEKGFQVISNHEISASDSNSSYDIMTISIPNSLCMIDIELGIKVLDSLGALDIGQSIIVEDGYILGIEAAEGTNNLIKRCADLRKKQVGGVLVKMMKPGQDKRLDMPVIGPETIMNLVTYSYHGLALEKNSVFVIQPELTVKLANQYGLFIISK